MTQAARDASKPRAERSAHAALVARDRRLRRMAAVTAAGSVCALALGATVIVSARVDAPPPSATASALAFLSSSPSPIAASLDAPAQRSAEPMVQASAAPEDDGEAEPLAPALDLVASDQPEARAEPPGEDDETPSRVVFARASFEERPSAPDAEPAPRELDPPPPAEPARLEAAFETSGNIRAETAAAPPPPPAGLERSVLLEPSPALRDEIAEAVTAALSEQSAAAAPEPAGPPPCLAALDADLTRATLWFDAEATALGAAQTDRVAPIARAAVACVSARFEIIGHADQTGDDAENFALSWARAEAVAALFRDAGVPEDRLRVIGAGSRDPLVDVPPDGAIDQHAINRRVQITRLP